jgi:hypothetical protein
MMRLVTNAGVLGLFVTLSATALQRWRAAVPLAVARPVVVPSIAVAPSLALDDSLTVAVDRVVTNDPFRLSNTPATVRFDARDDADGGLQASSPPSSRPILTLKGVTGGPPWQAMIDGIPGQPPGTIVRAGSRFDKLAVRLVTRDSVILQGFDTTWVLTFAR